MGFRLQRFAEQRVLFVFSKKSQAAEGPAKAIRLLSDGKESPNPLKPELRMDTSHTSAPLGSKPLLALPPVRGRSDEGRPVSEQECTPAHHVRGREPLVQLVQPLEAVGRHRPLCFP